MAHALVSGGTGYAGRFIVEALLAAGHRVRVGGRTSSVAGFFSAPVAFQPLSLEPEAADPAQFEGIDLFIHAAFDHVSGRYRGGEGDDPAGFRRLNEAGSIALFEAARAAGVKRALFLSSRAVYGDQPPGAALHETTTPRPDTLYGEVKLGSERALAGLARLGFATASLRATGIYGPAGPGRAHKWAGLFADYLAGRPIAPRAGTEVHGADLAAAVLCLAQAPPGALKGDAYNVSDLVIDRRDILGPVKTASGVAHPLPAAGDTAALNVMDTSALRGLGWQPGGRALFDRTLAELIREVV